MRSSSSISSEAIGANGSIPASSSLQLPGLGRDVLGRQRRDHQLARPRPGGPSPVSSGSAPARVFSSSASAACSSSLPCCRASAAVAGLPTSWQYSACLGCPLLRGEQVGRRVGVPARPRHEHIPASAARPAATRSRTAPSSAGRRCRRRTCGPWPGSRRTGPARTTVGAPAGTFRPPVAFSSFKIGHGLHQLGGARPALEVDHCQHVRGELPQVGVGGVHRRQAAMVAGQRLPRHRQRPPAACSSRSARASSPPTCSSGMRRVGQHRQDHIHQQLPGLALLRPLGQRLVGLGLRPRFPRRHRLVEQRHDLVQLVDRGLRRPAPARSGTGAPRAAPAPAPWTGGPPWPGTGAARSAASTGPAGARPCRAGPGQLLDRGLHRASRSPPPPAWSATPAGSSPARRRPAAAGPDPRAPDRSADAPPSATSAHPPPRGPRPTISISVTTPGRITFADIRYSARQVEQQRRRIMLHRPVQQELLQLLHSLAARPRVLPPQILGDRRR